MQIGKQVDFRILTYALFVCLCCSYAPASNNRAFFDSEIPQEPGGGERCGMQVMPAACLFCKVEKWEFPKVGLVLLCAKKTCDCSHGLIGAASHRMSSTFNRKIGTSLLKYYWLSFTQRSMFFDTAWPRSEQIAEDFAPGTVTISAMPGGEAWAENPEGYEKAGAQGPEHFISVHPYTPDTYAIMYRKVST
eukprot:s997_g3.t1